MNRDPLDALMEARSTMPHPCPHCGEDVEGDECECGAYWTHTCNLCDRPIPRAEGCALCGPCERTAKAHARLADDAMRYPNPEPRHHR